MCSCLNTGQTRSQFFKMFVLCPAPYILEMGTREHKTAVIDRINKQLMLAPFVFISPVGQVKIVRSKSVSAGLLTQKQVLDSATCKATGQLKRSNVSQQSNPPVAANKSSARSTVEEQLECADTHHFSPCCSFVWSCEQSLWGTNYQSAVYVQLSSQNSNLNFKEFYRSGWQ